MGVIYIDNASITSLDDPVSECVTIKRQRDERVTIERDSDERDTRFKKNILVFSCVYIFNRNAQTANDKNAMKMPSAFQYAWQLVISHCLCAVSLTPLLNSIPTYYSTSFVRSLVASSSAASRRSRLAVLLHRSNGTSALGRGCRCSVSTAHAGDLVRLL